MKRILLTFITLSLLLVSHYANASHVMGGDITWVYAKAGPDSGKFKFRISYYRDCNGIVADPSITLSTNAPIIGTGILCLPISTTEISPVGLGCATCLNPNGSSITSQEIIYESSYIRINGIPPMTGWNFWWNICCRNSSISNISAAFTTGITMRAIMYPFNNQNTFPAYDNSPQFLVAPILGSCIGSNSVFSQGAYDPELDSLSFDWDYPLDNGFPGTNAVYNSGYSFDNPLPDTTFDPLNIPATINHINGNISFNCNNQGTYIICIKVTSWKCGQKTAEIFRDIPITLTGCQISLTQNNHPPQIILTKNGMTFYNDIDTIEAGDSINYLLTSIDFETLRNSTTAQTITLNGYSPEFGLNFTDTLNGCLVPPCATLDNPSPNSTMTTIGNNLHWKTACAHISWANGCLQHTRLFMFTFKANDDFCSTNGVRFKTIDIVVRGPEIYLSGNSLVLSNPQGNNYSVQWYNYGIAIPGATDTIFTPTQSGIYSLIATTSTGCQELSNVVNRSFTGITDNSEITNNLNVHYDGNINIVYQSDADLQTEIQVTDTKGSKIFSKIIRIQNGAQHIVLNSGILANGIYILTLTNEKNKISSKFVVN